jgi:tetratricopeptide (TPR) repeat protein
MTSARAAHLDQSDLLRFVVSDLGETRRRQVKQHAKECGTCARALEETRRLDGGLRGLGDALYFTDDDSFLERPRPAERPLSEFELDREVLQMKAREALPAAREKARALFGEAAGTGIDPVQTLDLRSLADRWALGRALEGALDSVAAAPRRCLALAQRAHERLEGADQSPYATIPARRMTAVEYAAPLIDLFALAKLAKGAALVEMARFEEAEAELRSAYRSFGEGRGSEHHFAWVEIFASRCLSMSGRPGQGLVLAERAHATFEGLGLPEGAAEATLSSGIARYYLGRPDAAEREFHRAESAFARLERWDSYVAAIGCEAFAFMEVGRLDKALESYAKARKRAARVEANEAYFDLTADVRLLLERESLWKVRRCGSGPRVHLPMAFGARDGRQVANELLGALSEKGLEKAKELLGKVEDDPCRGHAYLYACLLAMPRVATDPAMCVEFARAVAGAARSLPTTKDRGPARPVRREQVFGEVGLLESGALNFLGKPSEARILAHEARVSFSEAGEDSYALALVDFYEGSAASFDSDSRDAWKLLRRACSVFQLYRQANWQGRAEATIGVLLTNREGRVIPALGFFRRALRNLRPETEATPYAATLINRGYALVRLSRFDEAKANYARALPIARRLDMKVSLLMIRYGLATIDLQKNRILRALDAFQRLSSDAASTGLTGRVVSADLRIAECLGRIGREEEMVERVKKLRALEATRLVEYEPAIRELFAYMDNRSVSYDLLAHVARFAEARDCGARVAYKPFRGVAKRA